MFLTHHEPLFGHDSPRGVVYDLIRFDHHLLLTKRERVRFAKVFVSQTFCDGDIERNFVLENDVVQFDGDAVNGTHVG